MPVGFGEQPGLLADEQPVLGEASSRPWSKRAAGPGVGEHPGGQWGAGVLVEAEGGRYPVLEGLGKAALQQGGGVGWQLQGGLGGRVL